MGVRSDSESLQKLNVVLLKRRGFGETVKQSGEREPVCRLEDRLVRCWARQAAITGRYEPEAQENTGLINEENADKN